MFKILLALHVLFAIFAVGPLVHAATTASRGVRQRDAVAVRASARMVRIYASVSVLVVLLGFGLMSSTSAYTHQKTAEFTDLWIWLSVVLWVVAMALSYAVVRPALLDAGDLIDKDESASVLLGRVAAAGGLIGVIFAVIVFLMVYRPGG